jgi:hypothetical protein
LIVVKAAAIALGSFYQGVEQEMARRNSARDNPRRRQMRMRILVTSAAVAALSVATLIPEHADAMPMINAENAHAALDASSPVEKTACWGYGWRGWGWYSFCGPPPAVVPAPVVVPALAVPAPAYAPGCRDVTIRDHRGDETVVRHIHRCY